MRLLAALVAVSALGCKNTLHWHNIEDDIGARLVAKGVHPDSVICPETEVLAHLRFDCVASFSDTTFTVHVELLDQLGSYQLSSD
ncbi:MAG: hypothetical protein K8W52_29465 [Deltaproteobacteria bacterium]|nr:hypothetical protein [Deltaproteobacteria bacterium]